MKKILVVSDSHHNNQTINKILVHHPEIEICIHCGDLQDQIETLNTKTLYLVKGNHDILDLPDTLIINIESTRILITHGHLQNVELSLSKITDLAIKEKVDTICFGHTHNPIKIINKDILIINPGSIKFPKNINIFIPTYAILTINKNQQEVHFYHADSFDNIDDLVYK